MILPQGPFERLRLTSFVMLSVMVVSLVPACAKKDKEPSPPLTAQATAAVSKPAPAKCDPGPDGKCQPSPTCSPECKPLATPECVKCEAAGDCSIFANNCESPLLSAAEKKTCYDIQTCVESSHCFEGSDTTLGSCYCGKLDTKSCLAAPMSGPGAPAGACHDVILKGMPNATAQHHVLGNLTTRDRAAGLALSRFNCQKIGNRKACAAVCGWMPQ